MKLKLKEGQKLWVTSDTHYMHKNICRGVSSWTSIVDCTRDFSTLEKMNHAITTQINMNVGQDDVLLHLGDWSFGGFEYIQDFRNRIVCNNIHLFLGNHDHHVKNNRDDISSIFSSVNIYDTIEVSWVDRNLTKNEFKAVCFHYPIASWENMNKGVYHLHGHVHLPPDKKLHDGRSMDVGMDGHPGFRPYELSEIVDALKDKPIKKLSLPKDHHEARDSSEKTNQ